MARNLETSTNEKFQYSRDGTAAIHEAKCDNKWSGTTTMSFHHGNHRGGHHSNHRDGNHLQPPTARSMAPLPQPKLCHPNLHEPQPKSCHSKPKVNRLVPPKSNANLMHCRAEPKPHTHVRHTLSSLLPWPSLLSPSSPLPWPQPAPHGPDTGGSKFFTNATTQLKRHAVGRRTLE